MALFEHAKWFMVGFNLQLAVMYLSYRYGRPRPPWESRGYVMKIIIETACFCGVMMMVFAWGISNG